MSRDGEVALSHIHRHVPPASAGKSPWESRTCLLLHGTGGNEESLLPLGRRLVPGARLLSPRGQVLENGMPRFFRRLAEGVFDEADLVARAAALAGFVRDASEAYEFDPAEVVAVGYSNGANIAAALLLLHPRTLRAAVLFKPMVPIVPERLPSLQGVGVFVAAGRQDPLVPAEETERLVSLLEGAGADVTVHWHAGGHELSSSEIDRAAAWLRDLPQ